MGSPLRVWLVEDESTYRSAFVRLLGTTDDFDVGAAFESVEDLEAHGLDTGDAPHLVVMDLNLPGLDGIDGTRRLRQRLPDTPVLILTTHDDPPAVFDAVAAGASGYVVKGTPPERMFAAMREACDGGSTFSPSVARHVLARLAPYAAGDAGLSERETQVLRELAAGRSKAAIADVLYLSPHTVDTHLRSVYRKLHVRTAAAAAAAGVRLGIV